jgi:aryl-alcohol dehydrogenase-like predicted oxidoreductase
VSNTPAWLISKFNTLAQVRGLPSFIANQMEYNLVDRSGEAEFSGLLDEYQMSNLIWSPLASGLLTGKYSQKERGEFRIDATKFVAMNERNLNLAAEVTSLAQEANLTPAEVALRWVMQKSPRNTPILGARKVEQLQANMKVLECTLDNELMLKLDKLSQPQPIYPYSRLYPQS